MKEKAFVIEYDYGLTETEIKEQLQNAFKEGQLLLTKYREGTLIDDQKVSWLHDCDEYEISSVRTTDTPHKAKGMHGKDLSKKRYTVTVTWFSEDSQ